MTRAMKMGNIKREMFFTYPDSVLVSREKGISYRLVCVCCLRSKKI